MNWQGKRVLVTGAGGFIGSHLTEKLVTLGAHTRAMVHYRSDGSWGWLDYSPFRDEIEVIAGDITDQDSVAQVLAGREVVFHLAALIAIPYSYQTPLSYVRTNVEGTVNVLQAARRVGIERVVHTSSSETYGTARYVPIDEDHPLQGQSPYAASKIAADKMAESFYLSYGLPVATIRPFNVFGPRQSSRAIVPTIITQALKEPEVRLGNLTPTRDFTYVADTVEGFVRVAECDGAIGQVVNIGTGEEISIENLCLTILDLTGRDIPISHDAVRSRPETSEVGRLCAANLKARDLLGWSPRHGLKDGLTETIDWMRENLERYRTGIYAV